MEIFVRNIRGLDFNLSIVVHIGCARCLLENLMSFLAKPTPRPIGQKTILPVLKGSTFNNFECVLKLH